MHKSIFLIWIILIVIATILIQEFNTHQNLESIESLPFEDQPTDCFLNFEKYLERQMKRDGLPGLSMALVQKPNLIYTAGFGNKIAYTRKRVDNRTQFRLASVSKGFAPILVGILKEEGLIDWDDKVLDYFPQLRLQYYSHTQKLTIRHLLSHTSGLPRHAYSNLLNMDVPYEEILLMLKDVRLYNEPGQIYNYQNVMYNIITDVVENITGKTYEELLKEKIFTPLGMHSSSCSYHKIVNSDNYAPPHYRRRGRLVKKKVSESYYSVPAAAGVNSSAEDLGKWLNLLLGNRPDIISKETLEEIYTPQINVDPREDSMKGWRPMQVSAYGLGWRIAIKNGVKYVFHGGYLNGYRTEIALCPEKGIGIALLSNASNGFIGGSARHFLRMCEQEGVDYFSHLSQ